MKHDDIAAANAGEGPDQALLPAGGPVVSQPRPRHDLLEPALFECRAKLRAALAEGGPHL